MTLDEIETRVAVTDALYAYASAIDGRDWDALAALFAPDAVLDYTASRGPRATLAEAIGWLRASLGGFAATQHLISNVRVEVSGDRATATSSYFNPMRPAAGNPFFVGGTYETAFVRLFATWRIAEHIQRISWMDRSP